MFFDHEKHLHRTPLSSCREPTFGSIGSSLWITRRTHLPDFLKIPTSFLFPIERKIAFLQVMITSKFSGEKDVEFGGNFSPRVHDCLLDARDFWMVDEFTSFATHPGNLAADSTLASSRHDQGNTPLKPPKAPLSSAPGPISGLIRYHTQWGSPFFYPCLPFSLIGSASIEG